MNELNTKKSRLIWLEVALLLTILALLGAQKIWIFSNSPAIAKDSVYLLRMAQDFDVSIQQTVKQGFIHPGFPAMVNITHSIFFANNPLVSSWVTSGFIVSLSFHLLGLLGIWAFARLLFSKNPYRMWISLMSILLIGLSRKMVILGADVLSDSSAACFAIWATVAVVMATNSIIRKKVAAALVFSTVAGILSAMAYLVRFETIACIAVIMFAMFAWPLLKKQGRGLMVGCLALMCVCIFLTTLPYTATIGTFSNKFTLKLYVAATTGNAPLLATATPYVVDSVPILKFLTKFAEFMHPANTVLLVMYLLSAILAKSSSKFKAIGDSLPRPAGLPACIAIGILLIFCGITSLHYSKSGALSARYLCIPIMLVAPFAAAEIIAIMVFLSKIKNAATGKIVATLLLGGIALGMGIHSTRPTHIKDATFKNSGEYIYRNIGDKNAFVDSDMVHLYSHSPQVISLHNIYLGHINKNPNITVENFTRDDAFVYFIKTAQPKYDWVALTLQEDEINKPKLKALKTHGYRPIKEFKGKNTAIVVIYSKDK